MNEGQQVDDGWMGHMRRGDFAAAWEISDRVLRERAGIPCSHLPRHLQYFWNGEPLDGKRVLVRCYHGLGDTIQFIRYAPLLRSVASEVLVWAQPKLISLLRSVSGIDLLLPLHDGVPGVEFDTDVEVMELPHVFRTTIATIPAAVPYLHVTPASIPKTAKLAVGLTWAGGDWDQARAIPFAALQPFTRVPEVDWYIFQRDEPLAYWPHSLGTIVNAELSAEARIIKALDLMISVDTMTAHLAGALGVPVWTLLQKDADWRWLEEREDSPWYPTMRLFRQERQGDWTNVVNRVIAALAFTKTTSPLIQPSRQRSLPS
jgi:hypothetical protein